MLFKALHPLDAGLYYACKVLLCKQKLEKELI